MSKTRISTGGDPRALAEFSQLRDEISKLTHPARPDVDWLKAEQLSLTLFRNNGVELQTLAWYTVARIHNAGLSGLAEGAELLDALVSHHWTGLWPQQTHARVEVLAWLSARLQQELRTLPLTYGDLPQVYRVEQSLKHSCDVLQRLELKTLSKLETVAAWMHNAALRLEKAEAENGTVLSILPASGSDTPSGVYPVTAAGPDALPPLVFVVKEPTVPPRAGQPSVPVSPVRHRMWQGFVAGVALTAAVSAGVMWAISRPSAEQRFIQPLPSALTPEQVSTLKQSKDLDSMKPAILAATQQQLDALHPLAPLWSRDYARTLTQQLTTLWPGDEQVAALAGELQHRLASDALPDTSLQSWHQAQQGLETMTAQLNALDERKGKYLTGSELKSAVFSIRRALDETPPPEELLRRMEEQQRQGGVTPAQYQQMDSRLDQLLNRYALLKQRDGGTAR
ncbi:ImpA domain-containing protein [Salmonella enterica subsp. enterica]|nr:ImpA domain-containing protein [Salmonella enterica subsp. enterica]